LQNNVIFAQDSTVREQEKMFWIMRVRQIIVNRSEYGVIVLITEPGERCGLVNANRLKRNLSGR
jgi:hypothetical protein